MKALVVATVACTRLWGTAFKAAQTCASWALRGLLYISGAFTGILIEARSLSAIFKESWAILLIPQQRVTHTATCTGTEASKFQKPVIWNKEPGYGRDQIQSVNRCLSKRPWKNSREKKAQKYNQAPKRLTALKCHSKNRQHQNWKSKHTSKVESIEDHILRSLLAWHRGIKAKYFKNARAKRIFCWSKDGYDEKIRQVRHTAAPRKCAKRTMKKKRPQ